MNRGDVWLTQLGRKSRPVVVVTRSEVLDVRRFVTVVEVTTSMRGLLIEVEFDHLEAGLDRECVINCDGIYTVSQST